jgi:tetratricopeptide (TPR) repeat protein
VLYDAYAYVPPEFERALPTAIGISYPLVVHFEPDLIVVRGATASAYRDTTSASTVRIGRDAFLDRHSFYAHLHGARIRDYALAHDFAGVAVYQRSAGKRLPESGPGFTWPERVNLAMSDRYYGQNVARATMGDIALDLENWDEAAREYRLGTEVDPDDPVLHYTLGRACLSAGMRDSAEAAFAKVFDLDHARPAAYNAASRHTVARHYFDAGLVHKAIDEAQRALELDPNLGQAHFDLALFHLVEGEPIRADSMYSEAVERFGPDSTAARDLQNLIRNGIRSVEARRILESRF